MGDKRKNADQSVNAMLCDIVVGIEDSIERKLKTQGHSQRFIDEIISKVDDAVKYAGLLGRNIESIALNKKLAMSNKINRDLVIENKKLKKKLKELGGYEDAVL